MSEFLSFKLEIPRSDGVGAPLDVSEGDSLKSLIFQGARAGRFFVEGSHDGTSWATLYGRDRAVALFTGQRSVARTVEGVAKLLRVRALATRGVAPPNWLDVGALPVAAENVFATISAPPDTGLGKPLDLGVDTGLDKTFIVGGRLPMGSRYSVLASIDGERFGEVLRFSGGLQDRTRSISAVCRYLRLEKTGRGAGPPVTVGAKRIPADGGGPAPAPCPGQISVSDDNAVAGDIGSDEQIMREYFVPLSSLGGRRGFEVTLTGFFAAEGSGSGEALFRVRMGGHSNAPDGETLLELGEATNGTARVIAATIRTRPPEGAALIKLTGQSRGQRRAVVRGIVIAFRSLS